MDATKEQCDNIMKSWKEYSNDDMTPFSETHFEKQMNEFLEKVKKKLPSEASLERDRARNRRGKKAADPIQEAPRQDYQIADNNSLITTDQKE